MKVKRKNIQADEKFPEWLDEISISRVKSGLDKKPVSKRRLTLALTRVPNLKEVLLSAEIKEELERRKKK